MSVWLVTIFARGATANQSCCEVLGWDSNVYASPLYGVSPTGYVKRHTRCIYNMLRFFPFFFPFFSLSSADRPTPRNSAQHHRFARRERSVGRCNQVSDALPLFRFLSFSLHHFSCSIYLVSPNSTTMGFGSPDVCASSKNNGECTGPVSW